VERDDDIAVAFGNRLRELRMKTGMSQEAFALHIGMDRSYYGTVELGRRNISLRNIKKIADGLNIDISKLLDFNDDRKYL